MKNIICKTYETVSLLFIGFYTCSAMTPSSTLFMQKIFLFALLLYIYIYICVCVCVCVCV